jgi:hypothetical protein
LTVYHVLQPCLKAIFLFSLTCRKVNKQALREQSLGGRNPGLRPFQNVHVDYTELLWVSLLTYLLVIVDHLNNWIEAIPLSSATTNGVVRMLLDNTIPQFGLIENIDSANGSHFTANIIRVFARALDIRCEYHTPWHPPSSEKVERLNQIFKK